MDPNQMPQAPFSPQPTPAPQPAPAAPYQAPVTPQPTPTVAAPQTAAIDEMTTPQANQNAYEATEAITAAMTPEVSASAEPIAPAQPVMPEQPAPQPVAPEATPAATPEAAPAAPIMQPDASAPIANQPAPKAGGKKKILVPILAIACIAIVIGAGFLIYSLISNGGGHKGEKALLAESIFVPKDRDSEYYALFDKNGKQLTEFNITEYSTMVAKHSLVKNDDGKYGIIDQSGKMTVDWQDKEIKSYGGLYGMKTDKDDTEVLITGSGKEIDLIKEDEEVEAPHSSPITVVYHKNIVDVYTTYGDRLDEFAGNKDDCEFTYNSLYMAVLCKDQVNIYDYYNLKKTIGFKVSEKYDHFYAESGGKIFGFLKYDDDYDVESSAVFMNNKLYDLGDLCTYIYVSSNGEDIDNPKGGYATCRTDDGTFLISKEGKITDVNEKNSAIFDADHYATYDEDDNEVKIYADGKEVAKAEAKAAPTINDEYYVIRKKDNSAIYDLNGKKVFNKDGTGNIYLDGLDKFNNVIVSSFNDDYEMESYLSDKDGKELTKKYNYISIDTEGYYYLTNSDDDYEKDDKITVMDKNQKVIIDSANCNSLSFNKYAKRFICAPGYGVDEGEVRLYDQNGKELMHTEGRYETADTMYHFTVRVEDKEKKYYTASGELFYTVK